MAVNHDPFVQALLVLNNGQIEELADHIRASTNSRQQARLIERLTSLVSSIAERMA